MLRERFAPQSEVIRAIFCRTVLVVRSRTCRFHSGSKMALAKRSVIKFWTCPSCTPR